MQRRNTQTNRLIMWMVTVCDFVLLNAVIYAFSRMNSAMAGWTDDHTNLFYQACNFALALGEWKFHTIIHERVISAGDVLKGIIKLSLTQMAITYIVMRHFMFMRAVGWVLIEIGATYFVLLLVVRLMERNLVKRCRRMGCNIRSVTLVGSDSELCRLYQELFLDPTTGYRIDGYYADEKPMDCNVPWKGTIEELINGDVPLGDEMYVCLSRTEGNTIRRLSQMCDSHMTRFFYVPLSVESMNLNLKRQFVNDIEIFTTHDNPLQNPVCRGVKRLSDIVMASLALMVTGLLFPFIWVMIKIQSPGPIFFRQQRTGHDGKTIEVIKFRSMHVNEDSDKVQATKNDKRKFPFGSFMRKTNLDELPQFWNVLRGDMSIVGPRPHMLKHTEMYSRLIDKYMVRHFLKPGITGWAQVTGYRGETRELWQMEGRVQRDIWYMEHWTFWLDIRIIWLTIKSIFIPDKNAY